MAIYLASDFYHSDGTLEVSLAPDRHVFKLLNGRAGMRLLSVA